MNRVGRDRHVDDLVVYVVFKVCDLDPGAGRARDYAGVPSEAALVGEVRVAPQVALVRPVKLREGGVAKGGARARLDIDELRRAPDGRYTPAAPCRGSGPYFRAM